MVPILMYHSISSESKDRYTIFLSDFEQQLAWLYQEGYRSLSLEEMEHLSQEKLSSTKKRIILTFDDGNMDNYTYAYPLLCKYGFSAIFFVLADLVGKQNRMGWNELRQISNNGMIVGSHGLTHRSLKELSQEELDKELKISKKIIEEKLGLTVDLFSLPKGFYNDLVKKLAKKNGYKLIFTSNVGYNNFTKDQFLLKRFVIRNDYSLEVFRRIVREDFFTLINKKAEQLILKNIKDITGNNKYIQFKNKFC